MTDSTELSKALDHAIDLAGRLDPRTATVDEERELAEALLDVRSHLRTKRGEVDWHARTGEAKSMSREVYSAIHASPDELDKLKGRLRQHFLKLLPQRMPAGVVLDEREDAFIPDNFYDDLGIFINDLGRRSESDTEVIQLAIGAGQLLGLIDEEPMKDAGPVALASVLAALQAVSDTALSIHKRLNRQ